MNQPAITGPVGEAHGRRLVAARQPLPAAPGRAPGIDDEPMFRCSPRTDYQPH